MDSYEIFLLTGSFFGAMAVIAGASIVMDRGSVRIFATFAVLAGGALYMADKNSEEGINFHDLPPSINKLMEMFVK